MYNPNFASSDLIRRNIADLAKPPRRIKVSGAASEIMRVASPSGSSDWDGALTPYMIAPMDDLASRLYEAVVFVGPARSGKTQGLVDGWISYAVPCDPGDMLLYFPTELNAYDYSKRRLRRLIDNSPELAALKSPLGHDNNLGMTIFRHGMILSLEWPTSSHLAQKDARYVGLSDYDSMPADVGGEGSPFDLAKKRVQAMMSAGMAMAESSPKRPLVDSDARPTGNQAPATDGGILQLYNRGTMNRWYWPCLHCGEPFEAPGLPEYQDHKDIEVAAKSAFVSCKACGGVHRPKDKRALQQGGHWVPDPAAAGATTASYWVKGTAAAFQTWQSLVRNYLTALRAYEQTGLEDALKTTVNVDQGMYYTPRHMVEDLDNSPEKRKEPIDRYMVPEWTRFLKCAVDVQGGQKSRFVVQVHAVGKDMESAIIDRYDITDSPGREGSRIDPAGYPEDWDILTTRVINATYRIDDEKELQVLRTVVDYGGEDGVSANAARWNQAMRKLGFSNRVRLAKGSGTQKEAVLKTKARNKLGKKMLDVTLLMFNTNHFKDMIAASMRRATPGPNYMHFPEWLKQWFFDELRAEVRDKNGKWKKMRSRNEAIDLWAMIWASCYELGPADPRRQFDWDNPPAWAAPLSWNSHAVTKEERQQAQKADAPKLQPKKENSSFIPQHQGFIKRGTRR